MSERRIVLSTCIGCGRCDGAHDFACKGVAYHHEYAAEHPYGRLVHVMANGDDAFVTEGMLSCASPDGSESAKLAAIRERLMTDAASYSGHTRDCPGFADRNALLRMVDELTEELKHVGDAFVSADRECDDLRAKLARHDEISQRCFAELVETKAKLAGAEKRATHELCEAALTAVTHRAEAERHRAERAEKRAEAAEARVRELEEALAAKGVYDPS